MKSPLTAAVITVLLSTLVAGPTLAESPTEKSLRQDGRDVRKDLNHDGKEADRTDNHLDKERHREDKKLDKEYKKAL